jgi:tight adherence protein C
MPAVVIIIGLSLLSLGLILYALLPSKRDEQDTVQRRMSGKRASKDQSSLVRQKAKESVARKMVRKVAPIAGRPSMPKNDAEMSKLRRKLSNAGFRGDTVPTLFLASKTVLGIGFGAITLLVCYSRGLAMNQLAGFAVFAAAVAFMAPNVWLSMAAAKRAEKVRNGLPDSLDLMVISVEAGLGLDAAIQRVGDEMKNTHPVLSEEFQIASWEAQMGIPRAETLDHLAQRTGVAEVRSLVAIINQAEKFGTSIARTLRNQSDTIRVKRRQAAEEAAQKTTVKLMAPLVLFIFPAIFVVLAGPAAIRLIETLGRNSSL